jgi:glycosyl hydrolase family 42 (putative beta-galactosidase)
VPVPYVGIVPTWEALQLWRTRRKTWNLMMSEGLALALLDNSISFDVSPSTEMNAEWLRQQRVVALCGASALKDQDVRLLAGWVKAGGGLLATYDSGLYTEHGELRRDGGALRDLLGIEMKGEPLEGQADCFYRVKADHPALGEYGKGSVVMGDARLVPVEVREGGTLLADCWNLQMEEVRGPAIVCKEYGKGRTIYISGSLEAHYPSSRVASVQKMLVSIIRYLAADAPVPFHMSAPRGVYGVLRQSANGDLALWILANVGFKDASVGRMRQEFLPVQGVEVGILVPEGRQVSSVELLRARRAIPFTVDGKYAVASIPTVHIAELVHWKFS